MSYFIDDDASQVRQLKDKLDSLQALVLDSQFSVQQENVDFGQNIIPGANPISRGGGSGGGGGGVTFPIRPPLTTISSPSSTQDLDLNTTSGHVFKITVDKDFTLTFSNPPASGTQHEFEVELTNSSTSVARTVTLPSSVRQLSTITIPATTPVSRGVYTLRVNDATNYDIIQIVSGTTGTSFANQQLSNLSSPVLNTFINFNSKAPTNFNGYVSQIVGNTLVNDVTGATWTLPTGDIYDYKINGVSIWNISSVGAALAGSLNMNDNYMTMDDIAVPANPGVGQRRLFVNTATGEMSVRTAGGTTVSLEAGAATTFDDNAFTIQDEIDNTKTITFNASLLSASANVLMSYAAGVSRTYTFPASTGTIPLLGLAQTFSAEQTFSSKIKFSTDGTLDFGDSTHHANQLFTEQTTYRSISGPALSTTAYTTTDSSSMINNVPAADEYLYKIANTTYMRFREDANSRMYINSGAGKELGFVVSTANPTIGTSGTIEIPVDGGSVGSAAAADTDFGNTVGCIGLYLNTIGSGNPTLCIKIDDGTGTDNRWSATIINRTTGALTGSILT